MIQIKAVIFDMDGVLIDAKEWHYEAMNRALRLFGYEISRDDHVDAYDGLPTRKKLEMLSKQYGLPRKLHNFLNELKQRYTMEIVHQRCKPTFIHEHALSRLKSEGYKLGLASNSIRQTIEVMMSYASLTSYFDAMLSNQDVSKAKPDPEIYVTAAQRLGFPPNQCVVVEDNQHGIQAAEAAGAHVLRVGSVHDVTYGNIKWFIKSLGSAVA